MTDTPFPGGASGPTPADAASPADPIEEARVRLLEAALPHVVFDGWSKATLDRAIEESEVEPGLAHLAFPRGGIDMALAFHRMNDRRLVRELESDPRLAGMKIREKIAHAVRRRLELVADQREAVRRGATLLALPLYAPEGAAAVWQTADAIWTAIGDTSTDYNWYSKRAILSSVYSATVLYWLGDETPGQSASWDFLDRRIGEVMRFEKVKAKLAENPLAKAALWAPTRLLEAVSGRAGRRFGRHGMGGTGPTPDPSAPPRMPGAPMG